VATFDRWRIPTELIVDSDYTGVQNETAPYAGVMAHRADALCK
jgi:hypothetical protein